jgi:hypothetical protein
MDDFVLLWLVLQDHSKYDPNDRSTWTSWLHTPDNLISLTYYERYVSALYWSLSTMTTVGYGDVTPAHSAEKVTAMVGMVTGVTVFAYVISSIAAVVSRLNFENAKVSAYLQVLSADHGNFVCFVGVHPLQVPYLHRCHPACCRPWRISFTSTTCLHILPSAFDHSITMCLVTLCWTMNCL